MSFELRKRELEAAAAKAGQLFTRIYLEIEKRDVAPNHRQEELDEQFRHSLRTEGLGLVETLKEFEDHILPNSMTIASPMYMGLVNSSPLPAGPLADLLISALNNNGGTLAQFPAISSLEKEVVRSFGELVYEGRPCGGLLLPGGTMANLQGLTLARAQAFPEWLVKGFHAVKKRPRLYLSESTHFCVERAARILGLGGENLVRVPTDDRGAMRADELAGLIASDRTAGYQPFCVAATLGTTGTGAVDPVNEMAEICSTEKLWLHVDACYGGASLLLDSKTPGVPRADSVAIDPHKWFFIPMVAGLILTPHQRLQSEVFSTSSQSYIPDPTTAEPYLSGIATSRRASALAVWMSIRAHGWNAVAEAVNRNIRLTRLLEQKLETRGFEVLPQGELSVACFRAPGDDSLQSRVAQAVSKTGQAWFGTVRHLGKVWMRCNIVNLYTQEKHVDRLVDLIPTDA